MKRGVSLSMAAIVFLAASTTAAQPSWKDRQQAARLTQQGKVLVKKGQFGEAADKFREADGLSPAPSVKLELVRMLLELQAFREAKDVAEACTADKAQQWADRAAQQKCKKLVKEIDDRTPTIAVSIFEPSASEVEVTIDGEPVDVTAGPVAFDPGEHQVSANADGYEDFDKTVTLAEGQRESLEITMKKTAAVAAGEGDEEVSEGGGISPVPAYISWGVGAVGLGIGIGFGIAAVQSTNDFIREYDCDGDVCSPGTDRDQAQADLEVTKLNGNVSTAGFVIGFAGIITGTVLFVFSDVVQGEDEGDASATILPAVGPGYVGVVGTF